jgi:hypothetical protein
MRPFAAAATGGLAMGTGERRGRDERGQSSMLVIGVVALAGVVLIGAG